MSETFVIYEKKRVFKSIDDEYLTIEVTIKKVTGNTYKQDYDSLEILPEYYTVSFSGSTKCCCGQIQDDIQVQKYNHNVSKIVELWKKYHLNDAVPGTCRQMELLNGKSLDYESACEFLKQHDACIDRGYKYGSKWLMSSVPDDVITEIIELFDMVDDNTSKNVTDEMFQVDLFSIDNVTFTKKSETIVHGDNIYDKNFIPLGTRSRYIISISNGTDTVNVQFYDSINNYQNNVALNLPEAVLSIIDETFLAEDYSSEEEFLLDLGYDEESVRKGRIAYRKICDRYNKLIQMCDLSDIREKLSNKIQWF